MDDDKSGVKCSCTDVILCFGFFILLLGGAIMLSGHYEKLSCSDHKDAGFNTVLKGDWFIPQCFIGLKNTSNMIPLGRYVSVNDYKQLA